jgi:hypothetical protein
MTELATAVPVMAALATAVLATAVLATAVLAMAAQVTAVLATAAQVKAVPVTAKVQVLIHLRLVYLINRKKGSSGFSRLPYFLSFFSLLMAKYFANCLFCS